MSAYGIIRSFAEAREHDDAPVRTGITYGIVRELVSEIDRLRAKLAVAREALQLIDEAKATYPGQRFSLFYARRAARKALDAIEEE